jgi:DNA-binding IclR family transcriptional regulator
MGKLPDRRGVNSIEVGAGILRCFTAATQPLSLSAIAASTAMLPGKTHRYLRSFIAAGLVVQEASTKRYDLGPLAYSLGASALQRYDAVRAASTRLAELRAACGESISLMIWGDAGGVVIRSEEGRQDVSVVLRVGASVRLVTSSAGRVFGAFLPPGVSQPVLEAEFAKRPAVNGERVTRAAYLQVIESIRTGKPCVLSDGPVSGATAMSAPLFSPDGRLVAVVGVVGRTGRMDVSSGGIVARELQAFCAAIQNGSV